MSEPGHDPTASLDPDGRAAMRTVLELLETERSSVSSVLRPDQGWKVHVADSLSGLEVPDLREAGAIADVGAGAGFPGLPLAAALPAARVDMIESIGRKCEFIERAIAAAGIVNARVLNLRSEEWAAPQAEGREAYDAVTARAVGRLSTLAELASPLLRDGGVLVAWKGRRDEDEERQLDRAGGALAMRPETILDVGPYAGSRNRHIHVLRKSGATPKELPRRPGIAKKRPRG